MKKISVLTALFALCAGATTMFGQAKSVILERVLVRVNGEVLSQSQLEERQIDALRDRNQQVQDSRALQSDAALQKLLADITPQLLLDAVDELLLVQRGRELGGKFSEAEFKDAIDNVKKQNNFDDAKLAQAMDSQGVTFESLRTGFERAAMVRVVQEQEILRRMNITEEELRQYYAGHRDSLVTPEQLTLREILVAVNSTARVPSADEEAAARAKIDALRVRATQGEDFAALVLSSSDSTSKANQGVIGPVNVVEMNPDIVAAVSGLKAGEISPPVRLATGFEIFKLEARTASEPLQFEKIRAQIEQLIRQDRLGGEQQKLLRRLRSQAVIEWKDSDFQKMYEQARADEDAGKSTPNTAQ